MFKISESLDNKSNSAQNLIAAELKKKVANNINSENLPPNYTFDINPILTKIFSYSSYSDLVSFNIVCKKWNLLISPIIHKSVRLLRPEATKFLSGYQSAFKLQMIEYEVNQCISINSKYSHFVKELDFNLKLKPEAAIGFFNIFKFLTKLNIHHLEISQDQFLCMIKPLNFLVELKLSHLIVKQATNKESCMEFIQLPPTLNRLELNYVECVRNPKLFIQSLNSHTNIKMLQVIELSENGILTSFTNHYPSLMSINYSLKGLNDHYSLFKILYANPQIAELVIELNSQIELLIKHIDLYLTNLQVLSLGYNDGFDRTIIPPLFALTKSTNIKKLNLRFRILGESILDSILMNCPHLVELDIELPLEWTYLTKVIGQRCFNLKKLTFYSDSNQIYNILELMQKLYYNKFLLNSLDYKKIFHVRKKIGSSKLYCVVQYTKQLQTFQARF
jgi:hypothetical protein